MHRVAPPTGSPLPPPGGARTDTARSRPWLPLLLHAGGLAAGWTATVGADGAAWFGVRGPACPLGACLGSLACPGCGLLRATAATLQGDLALAFAAHPAGIAVAALLALGTALHFDILRRGGEMPWHRPWRRAGRYAFALAVGSGWLLRPFAP